MLQYQLETVPVPIADKNTKADSYIQLQIKKLYLALNKETYIDIRQQELATCKRIGYEFFCKEYFVVRHKSRYSCKSAIYFNLDKDIIKLICEFKFYYNKTDVTLTVLDRGNEITLANWPDNKHIICTINNDIPIKIPCHPYVFVNRSVLCNCGIEAENKFLLESSVITTMIMLYVLCKHYKLSTLIVSLALQQVKEVCALPTKQDNNNKCDCTPHFYIILVLSITTIGLVIFAILQVRRIKLCRGQLFSNIVKIMLFISDVQYCVPTKL